MLFGRRKTAGTIFDQHYKSMLNITKSTAIAQNPKFELLPAMFIIVDYAAASCGKDRREIASAIMAEINSIDKNLDKTVFDRRCALYGEIIRGRDLRCEWFMGDHAAFNDNAISKCTALLGDILYNPDCADNYDNAPVMLYGIIDAMSFTETVMKPLLRESVELFKDIYNL